MNEQKYLSPQTIEEAISLVSRYTAKAKIIAGGTDLVVQIKKKEVHPQVVISIAGVSALNYIKYDKETGLSIGALTPVSAIEQSDIVKSKFPVLAEAAGTLGSPMIRERATIGGNLCNAAPSADTAPALIVLGAKVKLAGARGERIIPLEEFFKGPGETALKPGEMLTEIQVPNMPPQSGAAYLKQKRRMGADLAVVGVAALVTMTGDICSSDVPYLTNTVNVRINDVKIALGAVAPTPIRAKATEAILKGNNPGEKLLEEACRAAYDECKPIDDCRSTAGYRRELVAVLTKRAVAQAIERVKLEV